MSATTLSENCAGISLAILSRMCFSAYFMVFPLGGLCVEAEIEYLSDHSFSASGHFGYTYSNYCYFAIGQAIAFVDS